MDKQRQIDGCLENLVILADVLIKTVNDADVTGTPTNQLSTVTELFRTSCKNVYDCCTKFSIAFNPPSSPQDCIPFAEKMEQACHLLVKSSQGILIECRAGPYLKQTINHHISEILKAVGKLAEALRGKSPNKKIIAPLTGVVWECVDRLGAVPLDEKVAILEIIKNTSLTVKDALSELEQLKSNPASSTKGTANEEDDDDDDDFMDFGLEGDSLTPQEQEVLPGTIQIIKLSLLFITKIEGIISLSAPEEARNVYNEWLNELRVHVAAVAGAVDELSCSVYSPQVRADVEKNFEKLKQAILDALPSVAKNKVATTGSVSTLLGLINQKITTTKLME